MGRTYIRYMRTLQPHGRTSQHEPKYKVFEKLLQECLDRLGHSYNSHYIFDDDDAACRNADFIIYAHRTKREIPEAHLYHKQMHLSHLFTLDHNGWGPDHSGMLQRPALESVDVHEARSLCSRLSAEFRTTGSSKARQPPSDRNLATPENYILVPFQRPTDDTIINHSPIEVQDFASEVSRWAERRSVDVVLKLHPSNNLDPELVAHAEKLASEHAHVHLLSGNINDFILRARGILCINSGVGFESLIHGKPVATLGNCDYKWATFCATPGSLDEALQYFDDYSDEQRDLAHQLVCYYCRHHAYSIRDEDLDSTRNRVLEVIKQRIAIEHGAETTPVGRGRF